MSVKDNKKMHLSFLFTSEGFRPDIFQNEDEIKIWTGETAYRSLYQFGMEGKPELWERMNFEVIDVSVPKKEKDLLQFLGNGEDNE